MRKRGSLRQDREVAKDNRAAVAEVGDRCSSDRDVVII